MDQTPYSRFAKENLILRDELAVDRTILANERTLLSYLRSAVSLAIAGVSIMHFVEAGWFFGVGAACLPVGAITGVVGTLRYRTMHRSISRLRERTQVAEGTSQ